MLKLARTIAIKQRFVTLEKEADQIFEQRSFEGSLEKYRGIIDDFVQTGVINQSDIERIYLQIGLCLSGLGRFREALDYYAKYTNKTHTIWYNMGNAHRSLHEHSEALECYDKSIALDPSYSNAWNSKGGVFLDQRKSTQALECFTKAGTHANALCNKGKVLYHLGEVDEAIMSLNLSLVLVPDNISAIPWLINSYIGLR